MRFLGIVSVSHVHEMVDERGLLVRLEFQLKRGFVLHVLVTLHVLAKQHPAR